MTRGRAPGIGKNWEMFFRAETPKQRRGDWPAGYAECFVCKSDFDAIISPP